MSHPLLEVRLSGSLACFTRPEMKVERVSYPVITPSAARGALEAIFWKPEFRWIIREIHVLAPIKHQSFVRNEVNHKLNDKTALKTPYFADDTDKNRCQRHTLALRDVSYVIRAEIKLMPGVEAPIMKYREMFDRRVAKGQCFQRPFLGCREFAADFAPVRSEDVALPLHMDLGLMLLDMDYGGPLRPQFFHAKLEAGVMKPPIPVQTQAVG